MEDALVIAILVVVCVILLFQAELYRNILNILVFYSHDAPPPEELSFTSFLAAGPPPPVKK